MNCASGRAKRWVADGSFIYSAAIDSASGAISVMNPHESAWSFSRVSMWKWSCLVFGIHFFFFNFLRIAILSSQVVVFLLALQGSFFLPHPNHAIFAKMVSFKLYHNMVLMYVSLIIYEAEFLSLGFLNILLFSCVLLFITITHFFFLLGCLSLTDLEEFFI